MSFPCKFAVCHQPAPNPETAGNHSAGMGNDLLVKECIFGVKNHVCFVVGAIVRRSVDNTVQSTATSLTSPCSPLPYHDNRTHTGLELSRCFAGKNVRFSHFHPKPSARLSCISLRLRPGCLDHGKWCNVRPRDPEGGVTKFGFFT